MPTRNEDFLPLIRLCQYLQVKKCLMMVEVLSRNVGIIVINFSTKLSTLALEVKATMIK